MAEESQNTELFAQDPPEAKLLKQREKPTPSLPHMPREHSFDAQKNADQRSLAAVREELDRIRNELLNSGSERLQRQALKLSPDRIPSAYQRAIPMVASVIAHRNNPENTIISPAAGDVYEMSPLLKVIAEIIKFFSGKLGLHFDGLVEKKATKKVDKIGGRIANVIETVKNIRNPQEQFVQELSTVYQGITQSESPKKAFKSFLKKISRAQLYGFDKEFSSKYPMLTNSIKQTKIPLELYVGRATIAMPEIMKGMEVFLKNKGVTDIENAPSSTGGVKRFLGEKFASQKLENVQQELPEILQTVFKILPNNGEAFASKMYGASEDITALKHQGMSNAEVGSRVLAAVKH